jgi:hypothetical protein
MEPHDLSSRVTRRTRASTETSIVKALGCARRRGAVSVVLKDGHVVLQRAGFVDAAQLGSWLAAA